MAKKKEDKKIVWIIIAVVIVVFLTMPQKDTGPSFDIKVSTSGSNTANEYNPMQNIAGDQFMKVRLYDMNGNLINSAAPIFSTVGQKNSLVNGGSTEISMIGIDVTISNTGGQVLQCNLYNLTPNEFNEAINQSDKLTLWVGGKAIWTSSNMSAYKFEQYPQPVTFEASACCSYLGEELPCKTGQISLNIKPSGGAGYIVEIAPGLYVSTPNTDNYGTTTRNLPVSTSSVCNNNVCESGETAVNCPNDCGISNVVRFRTSDLSYSSGSALAFSSTCGSSLTRYGYVIAYGILGGTCGTTLPNGAVYQFQIPGGWYTGDSISKLYTLNGDVFVCDSDGSKYNYKKYSSTDSDSVNVINTLTSYYIDKEVTC